MTQTESPATRVLGGGLGIFGGLADEGITVLPSLEVAGVYTFNDRSDPLRYGMTYYQSYYLKSAAYATLEAIMSDINTALQAASMPYECIEVDHYDLINQGWNVTAQWRNLSSDQRAVYHARPIYSPATGIVTYEYMTASPTAEFSAGDYVYFGFGRIAGSATYESDGYWQYREVIAPVSTIFTWQPKQ
ncbi:hypothetical protein A3D23_03330 [candidate division WOR-1 bacterium RIFCSPHIGHO2_02_FULL_53_26]|nr:MAG: hypothetical protein A3D23_03330 [candidate division WOR-1 bacterium RIFCSPHIGHO2_02_FULL_53_26]